MSIALEEAISVARAAVWKDGESIVIDRAKKTEKEQRKKRDRENDDKDLNLVSKKAGDVEFWKKKYLDVKALQEEAEDDLESQIQISKEREAALVRYSDLLQKKIHLIQGKSVETPTDNDASTAVKIDKQRKMLNFFELMTSMTVTEDKGLMVCTLKNRTKRTALRFTIKDFGTGDLEYVPKANINVLPEYMQSELTFERNMSPILLADALQALYDDGDE
jgi:antitoxin component of MazEF toxin-antitoxin module